jgi:hypothetical protein
MKVGMPSLAADCARSTLSTANPTVDSNYSSSERDENRGENLKACFEKLATEISNPMAATTLLSKDALDP